MKTFKLLFAALLLVTTLLIIPIYAQTGDADRDGVIDSEDVCPKTKGTKENKGCPKTAELTQENNARLDSVALPQIVAGIGSDQVVIGATRSQIEAALGTPEDYFKGNLILPNPSSHHRSKGIIVVYDAETGLVKEIEFVGNAAYLDAGSYRGPFTSFRGKPDKSLSWGASAEKVINAYGGAPKKRLVESRNGGEVATLIYDQIVFTFYDDKLYDISVADNNNRLLGSKPATPSAPTSTLKVPESQSSSRRVSALESAETPRDIAVLYNKYAREFQSLDTAFIEKVKVYNGVRKTTPVNKESLCQLLAEIKPAYSNLMQEINKIVGVIESGKLDRIPDPKGNEEIKSRIAGRRKNLLLLENAIKTDSTSYGCQLN